MVVHLEEYADGKLLNNRTWVTNDPRSGKSLAKNLIDTGSDTEVTVRCTSDTERQSFNDLPITVL